MRVWSAAHGDRTGSGPDVSVVEPRHLGRVPERRHVLALQRRVGNRAVADALVQRSASRAAAPVVQRDEDWGRLVDMVPRTPARPDMEPYDWTSLLGVAPPLPLTEIQLVAPPSPPPAPAKVEPPPAPWYVPPEKCQPAHHQRPERIEFDDRLFVDLDRQRAWESFQGTLSTLTMQWNSAVPLVNAYGEAQNDPSLQEDAMGLKSLGLGFVGDVGGMVELQRVPPASGSRTTVGDLFANIERDGITEHGTDLAAPPSAASLDKLAKDPKVRDARAEAVALDGDIARQLWVVKSKAEGITKAAADLDAARLRAELLPAREEKERAQGDLKKLEDAKKAAGENAKKITDLLTKIVTAESPAKAGAAVGEFVVKQSLELIAGQIVDARYADQIKAATKRLADASAVVRSLAGQEVQKQIDSAVAQLQQARSEFEAERLGMAPLLVRRRSAYEKLGRAIGGSAAAPSGARKQIQAIITAIPLVETVVGRLNNVVSTIGELPYSPQAAVGLSMARHAKWPIADQFISSVTSYTGLRIDVRTRQIFWQRRLESLRAVMRQLSGLGTPQR